MKTSFVLFYFVLFSLSSFPTFLPSSLPDRYFQAPSFLPHSGHCDPGLTSRQATKGSLWRGPAQEARTRDLDLPSLSLSLHFSYGIGPVLFRLCPQVASILVGEREKETNLSELKKGYREKETSVRLRGVHCFR